MEVQPRDDAPVDRDLWPLYRATFENAAVGIAHVAPDGRWLRANERMAEIAGYSREELLELRFPEITHPDDLDEDLALTRQLVGGEIEYFSIEKRYIRKDGRVKWVNVTVSLLRDSESRPQYFIGVVQDIDAQKAAEAEREGLLRSLAATERRQRILLQISDLTKKLAAPEEIIRASCRITAEALDCTRCGYLLLDSDRNRLTVEEDFTRDVPSVAGEYSLSLVPRSLRDAYRRGETVSVSNTETDPRTARWFRKVFGPAHAYASLSLPLVRGGRWVGTFGVHENQPREWTADEALLLKEVAERLLDAIERAHAERALQTAHDELERRVAARTADLETAHKRMETFTYHVSHDLRAPLRTIISTSRIIEEDFAAGLPDEARELMTRQIRAAGSLGNLIDDLLKLSRVGRAQILRETMDLTGVARMVADDVLSRYPQSTVQTIVEEGLTANADPRLLALALDNMIDNAVKYSPHGGTIRIGREGEGTFTVADEGIGIESQYLEKIFEPFQRLHRAEEFSGTGIGLANVRQVIERHGGRVWARSEPARGSVFCFTLPE